MHALLIPAVLLFLGGAGPASAEPAPTAATPGPRPAVASRGGVSPIELPSLVQDSDCVWKGQVIGASEAQIVSVPYGDRTVEAGLRTISFRADRAIKGPPPTQEVGYFDLFEAYVRGPMWGRVGGPFTTGWYGIVFLSVEGSCLGVTDPFHVGIQVSAAPGPPVASDDPFALVEGELVNTLRDRQRGLVQAAADLLVKLHQQVAVARDSGEPEDVVALDRPGALAAFHELADSPDPILAGAGYAAVLRLGDVSRLAEALAFVEQYGPPPGVDTKPYFQGTESTHYARGQILHAISELDDDAAAPLLNPLLLRSDSLVRRCAADALRRICHVSSMPYFAAALDDPDVHAAFSAIYGLLCGHQRQNVDADTWAESRRVGAGLDPLVPEWDSGMVPNWEEFTKDPESYRQWWKNWWETKGKAVYGSAAE